MTMASLQDRNYSLDELNVLAENYGAPFEDVLFIDWNRKGSVIPGTPHNRVRFYFQLSDSVPHLKLSKEAGIIDYFFAQPTRSQVSNYELRDGMVLLDGREKIGKVKNVVNDSVDATYPRKHGTVMNLNPSYKSACSGCDFCYIPLLSPNDRNRTEKGLEPFLAEQVKLWLGRTKKPDLSYLHRVDVVTGCFGGEKKAIQSLLTIRDVFSRYNYEGELFFLGSEITSDEGLDALEAIAPFTYCLTLETFTRRDLLKSHKKEVTLEDAKRILGGAKSNGFGSHFTYIAGLEPVETAVNGMKEFSLYVNRLPVINVFQPHDAHQLSLQVPEATNLDYFLKLRKFMESTFDPDVFKPRTWGNYRSLWYLKYGDSVLRGERLP
jgi:hypothetical protein